MSQPALPCRAILLCAGSGSRMGEAVADKIRAPLCNTPVFIWSLRALAAAGFFQQVVVVDRGGAHRANLQQDLAALRQSPAGKPPWPEILWVEGGNRRQDSVRAGLEALTGGDGDLVFVHDGARPLLQPAWLQQLRAVASEDGAACLGRWAVDTIKRVPVEARAGRQCRLEDLERDRLWVMETPQVFLLGQLREAYRLVEREGLAVTDDAGAAAVAGVGVSLVEAAGPNWKITRPADLQLTEFWLSHSGAAV